ncbi:MAG TPA: hypothetical protein VHE99_02505 [Gammaproteobacteria bacterium]|nr:hypothetical protein [Gammaproteobacteria bacterium]
MGRYQAECTSCFLIHRLEPASGQTFDTAGHYVHGLKRTEAGFRINSIVQTVLWSRGDSTIHGAFRKDIR